MARDLKLRINDSSADESKTVSAQWSQDEARRKERREALERLRGIGWDGNLEAMRLGLSDHSAK